MTDVRFDPPGPGSWMLDAAQWKRNPSLARRASVDSPLRGQASRGAGDCGVDGSNARYYSKIGGQGLSDRKVGE